MCGFLVIFGDDASVMNDERERRIASTLAHRGPDDFQTLTGPNYRAMFWRLSIVDHVGGKQPMVTPDGQTILLFNGEVYNYRAIRDRLERAGRSFRTASDTEVVLQAYVQWGVVGFDCFEGMFAICVIDRAADTVTLARDRLGVKPLYFSQEIDGMIVASEQKAILAYRAQSPTLDRESFLHYVVFQTVPQSGTLFEGIAKVPPGVRMMFDDRRGTLLQADHIQPSVACPVVGSYEEYRRVGHALILEQTRLALETDLPICFHLSGGLDSNSLVSLCRQLYPGRPFVCVSSFIDGERDAEWEIIHQAAVHHGQPFRWVDVTADRFWDLFDTVIYHLDEPVGDPGVVAQFLVNRLAGEESKIVYSGQGFDELFFGYIRDLAAFVGASWGPEALDTTAAAFQTLPPTTQGFLRGWEGFLKLMSATPPIAVDWAFFRKLCRFDPMGGAAGMAPTFLRRARRVVMNHYLAIKDRATSLHEFLLDAETTIQLPSLLHMEDRASMCYSLETRVPFCTASILDFARIGPLAWKFHDGAPKGFLRDIFRTILPPVIVERRQKVGRPIPFRQWLAGERGAPYVAMLERHRTTFQELTGIDFVEYALRQTNPYDRSAWAAVSIAHWIDRYNVRI